MSMDPMTIMTTISVGLKLVDQFRELTLRFLGKKPSAPSATVEQSEDKIEVKHHGKVTNEIHEHDLKLEKWDEVRYKALERRVKFNWDLYHELYGQIPELAVDEKARIKGRMDRIKEELCSDFRDMVQIYSNTLGVSLPDHYTLYEVCQN